MPDYESMMEEDDFSDPIAWMDHIECLAIEDEERERAEYDKEAAVDNNRQSPDVLCLRECDKKGCGGRLILRITKVAHRYFWGCSKFPVCRGNEDFRQNQVLSSKCPLCGSALVIRFGSRGAFVGCTRYPNCKQSRDLPHSNVVPREQYARKPATLSQILSALDNK